MLWILKTYKHIVKKNIVTLFVLSAWPCVLHGQFGVCFIVCVACAAYLLCKTPWDTAAKRCQD